MQYKKISLTSLFLPILMVLGLVLRIYGIHAESAWWDEYASLTFLDAPTLAQFLQQNRTLDPATLPLYFVLEYLWAHSISSSLAGLRLLSVGIGVATIPLVYALGARLFGKRAGYTAALLLALSPIHIHHSQGIRMYGLLVLLSVASMWSLLRMVQKGKRSGWWLHGLFSLLLYWTHPFALLVPAAQGGWLLLHRRLYRAMLPGWIMMHAMLALPVVGYILSIRFWPQETTGSWLEKPGLGTVIADLFFDDIISFHWQLRLGDIGIKLGVLRQLGDLAFAFVIIVCLAYVVFVWVQKSGTSTSRNISLLLCWLILPPLALFCISLLWRPCIFPRYTAHCSVALYLLAGGMVQQLRNREWRWSVYWILGFLMLFQGIVTLPGPQRTDWQSAAKHISENVQAQDIILVDNLLWRDVFLYNAKHVAHVNYEAPVAAAANVSLLAIQSILFLGVTHSIYEENTAPSVWAVIAADYFETSPPRVYEEALENWGIEFQRRKFPGIRDVHLYHLQAAPSLQLPTTLTDFQTLRDKDTTKAFSGYLKHDAMQAFAALATALAVQERKKEAFSLMQELFQRSPFAESIYGNLALAMEEDQNTDDITAAVYALWDGYGYRENHRHELARQSFSKALELDPQSDVAALELGLELLAMECYVPAADVLERAATLNGESAELVDNLVQIIRIQGDVKNEIAAVAACQDALIALSEGDMAKADLGFQHALTKDPQLPRAQVMLGFIRATQERYEEAFDLLSAYLAHEKYHSPVAYSHLALIYLLRDDPEQALFFANKAMALDPEFKARTEFLVDALLIKKDYAAAAQEIKRLKNAGVQLPSFVLEYLEKQIRGNQK